MRGALFVMPNSLHRSPTLMSRSAMAACARRSLAGEFRQRGEYPEHQPAAGRGVDVGSLACQHAEADFAFHQLMDRIDEVTEVSPEPVELPDDQCAVFAQRPEAGFQAGPVIRSKQEKPEGEPMPMSEFTTRRAALALFGAAPIAL